MTKLFFSDNNCQRHSSTMFATLLFVMAFATVGSHIAPPSDCRYDPGEGGDDSSSSHLTCRLSSINSRRERTDFSVVPNTTQSLTVLCSSNAAGRLEVGSFSTLANLRHLTIENCALTSLPVGAFSGLEQLLSLTVKNAAVSEDSASTFHLETGVLQPLASLQELDLSGNGLAVLPVRELCRPANLKRLTLNGNKFGAVADLGVAESSIRCLSQLHNLDLSYNEITSLDQHRVLISNPQLDSLNLEGNFIRFVGESVFQNMSNLQNLKLSNNQISHLPIKLFDGLDRLRELELANNTLSELPSHLFSRKFELENIDLSGNLLQTAGLHVNLTMDLVNLLRLDLCRNQLVTLPAHTIQPLVNLQTLKLCSNKLIKLEFGINKEKLVNLAALDLSFNQLNVISPPTFSSLPALSQLILSNNKLADLHQDVFINNTNILVLDLSYNQLFNLPQTLKHLEKLQTLDLSNNYIADLETGSTILKSMPTLWRLQLAGNLLTHIPSKFFAGMPGLQVLDLSFNRLSSLEAGSLDKNVALRAVRLDSNRLGGSLANVGFSNLLQLTWLNISDNHLQEFDYSHVPATLGWLDLSHNNIRELTNNNNLPPAYSALTSITYLDASFNKISGRVGSDHLPQSVQTLLLNDNKISQLSPYTFYNMENLTRIDLSVNELASISKESFLLRPDSSISKGPMAQMYMGGNPITCDCEMIWLKNINEGRSVLTATVENLPIVADLESIYCRLVYTTERTFVPLVEARDDEFLCAYETHCFSLCQCCQFDSCDCEMTCPEGCTCYHDATWTENIIQCSSAENAITAVPDTVPMDATQLLLDGNNLPILHSHSFIGRKNLRTLYLNNSNVASVENQTFNGLRSLTRLHLEDNRISSLNGFEFAGLSHLRELYLQNNVISNIQESTFKGLRSLEVLFLHGNSLVDFPVWQLSLNPYLMAIKIADNLWSCECEFLYQFNIWVERAAFSLSAKSQEIQSKIVDIKDIKCLSKSSDAEGRNKMNFYQTKDILSSCEEKVIIQNDILDSFEEQMIPQNQIGNQDSSSALGLTNENNYPMLIGVLVASIVLIALTLFAVIVCRHSIRTWLKKVSANSSSTERGLQSPSPSDSSTVSTSSASSISSGQPMGVSTNDMLFDAFISYSPLDAGFVSNMLLPELTVSAGQSGAPSPRLFLQHRDLPPLYNTNSVMPNQAVDGGELAVTKVSEASRVLVIVLSDNYLATEWCRPDVQNGIMSSLTAPSLTMPGGVCRVAKQVLFVLASPVDPARLDPTLRMLLKTSEIKQLCNSFQQDEPSRTPAVTSAEHNHMDESMARSSGGYSYQSQYHENQRFHFNQAVKQQQSQLFYPESHYYSTCKFPAPHGEQSSAVSHI